MEEFVKGFIGIASLWNFELPEFLLTKSILQQQLREQIR